MDIMIELQAPLQLMKPTLFLGGSITGAWNWQRTVIAKFQESNLDILVFNPRREVFDATDPDVENEQIEWEARYLRMADAIMFYFSKETFAPITLFELGRHSIIAGRPLFVGCEPEYKRTNDVRIQMGLVRPDVVVRDNLGLMISDVENWVKNKTK